MSLAKIICGVDLGTLGAARAKGLAMDGWMPKGWRVVGSAKPEFGERFGLRQSGATAFATAAQQNVMNAGATLVITDRPDSHVVGTAVNFATRAKRPVAVLVPPDLLDGDEGGSTIADVIEWLRGLAALSTLNVTGYCSKAWPRASAEMFAFDAVGVIIDSTRRAMA